MTKTTQVLPQAEMQILVKQVKMVGATVDPSPIVALKIDFENVEVISIAGTAVQELTIVPEKLVTEKPCLAGFQLKLAIDQLSAKAIDRLQEYEDIVYITVITQHQTVKYHTSWSPLSDPFAENGNQFCTLTAGQLEIATKIRRFYDWSEILVAAENPENIQEMSMTLSDKTPHSVDEYLSRLRNTVETMQASQAEPVSTAYLVVRHTPSTFSAWTPVIFRPDQVGTNGHYFNGIEAIPYPKLLSMQVRVETTGFFWQGMAWLFHQITLNGVDEVTRQAYRDYSIAVWMSCHLRMTSQKA